VIVRFWGTRGSVPTPGPATQRFGGNTSCVEVRAAELDSIVVLDAGTGICALGATLPADLRRVDILLSHLHMDHIIGLGFFAGLFRPGLEVHIWGPSSTVLPLRARLTRYLSPPLFPVRLRDLPCRLTLHDIPLGTFEVPGMSVTAALVCHPGPTVGYRLDDGTSTLEFSAPRSAHSSVHGTGCAFASAIAAGLALGDDLPAAVQRAKTYVAGAITHSFEMGAGARLLDHFWNKMGSDPLFTFSVNRSEPD